MAFKEIELPSGAQLKVQPASFADSKSLYQAILEEAKSFSIGNGTEITSLVKDLFCAGFSSKKVEAALWTCMQRCIYVSERGELKIDKDTFEPIESREDYMPVCIEVAKANILPFVKGLYAEYQRALAMTEKSPK